MLVTLSAALSFFVLNSSAVSCLDVAAPIFFILILDTGLVLLRLVSLEKTVFQFFIYLFPPLTLFALIFHLGLLNWHINILVALEIVSIKMGNFMVPALQQTLARQRKDYKLCDEYPTQFP